MSEVKYPAGLDDNKINSKYQSLLANNKKTVDNDGEDVKDIPHDKPASAGVKPENMMHGDLMNFTQILEALDVINSSMSELSTDVGNETIDSTSSGDVDMDELVEELNKIFTPVLVMQSMEKDISDKANSEISEATVLTERNMISFDDPARMAQLRSVCALIIARKKNTEKWQIYQKAANIKTSAKLDIQQEEYDAAETLAQKYLVKVSTTSNSSVARDAANELLPQTQH